MKNLEQEIEQPGKNAIEHHCGMKVEIPGDDDERSSFIKCPNVANIQCSECAAWLCGSEELMHAICCIRCEGWHCPEHHQAHRLSKDCEQQAA